MKKKPSTSNLSGFYIPAVLSSLFTLCITLFLFFETYDQLKGKNDALFDLRVEAAKDAIYNRLEDYIQILKGAQGFIVMSDSVTRKEWRGYLEILDVEERYPGVQGIGYTAFVAKENKSLFEENIRKEGFPQFHIWPESKNKILTTIIYLEPFDESNQRAFGYDMFTDSSRNKAMKIARDTGKPALTSGIILVQETVDQVQKGFNLYLPIYKNDQKINTVEERRENIMGMVYCPFRVNDLMDGILGDNFGDLSIAIYDSGEKTNKNLLYKYNDQKGKDTSPFKTALSLTIAEHTWDIHFSMAPQYAHDKGSPFYLLAGGILISGLVFIVMLSYGYIQKSTYLKQVITDNATAAIFILNRQGYCTFMNPAAENLIGYSFEEAKLEKLLYLLQNNDTNFETTNNSATFSLSMHDEVKKKEDIFIHKSGEIIHVSLSSKPIFEHSNKISLLLEARDISQEKEAESALKRKNKTLQTLNNIGINLSVELDLKKLLQQVTDACAEIINAEYGVFFYSISEESNQKKAIYALSGKDQFVIKQFLEAMEGQQLLAAIHDGITTQRGDLDQNILARILHGEVVLGSYLAQPVISRSGKVIGKLCFGHEKANVFKENDKEIIKGIAAQAAIAIDNSILFETISAKNIELTKINNDLDNFVYTASHDLKAPVLNIEGLVYVLNKALRSNQMDEVFPMLGMMETSVLKFKDTIQALTEVAKVNKNVDDEVVAINIVALFEDIKISIQDIIESSGAIITTKFQHVDVSFSKSNLRSILLNLVVNAIKYRSPNRQPIINLSSKKEGDRFVLKIQDNGLGIAKEYHSRIFLMFKRIHTQVEGTGIGLYLVKRIVENQGGTIAIESEINKGTTFTISLPLVS